VSPVGAQKRARLQASVREHISWADQVTQIKRMRQWLLDAEHILDGSWAQAGEMVTNPTVGQRLDAWRQALSVHLIDDRLSELEQACLSHFLQTLANQRSHLVQCYNQEDFPRTNNELERCIRGLKTQYRRISGRKNWNSYLLRLLP
jgi:Transposase IS66 family